MVIIINNNNKQLFWVYGIIHREKRVRPERRFRREIIQIILNLLYYLFIYFIKS